MTRRLAFISALAAGLLPTVSGMAQTESPAPKRGEKPPESFSEENQTDQEVDLWPSQQIFLAGHLTPGGPYGVFAVSGGYEPAGWLSFEAGVGVTPYAFDELRPQVGLMMRLRWLAFTHTAFGAEVGPSMGEHTGRGGIAFICWEGSCHHWDRAIWLHAGANVEIRSRNRVFYRLHLGIATLLNTADGEPGAHSSPTPPSDLSIPYFGLTVGGLYGL